MARNFFQWPQHPFPIVQFFAVNYCRLMQASPPVRPLRQRWESRPTRIGSPRLVPLRYTVDWRALIFLVLLTALFVVQWTGLFRSWLLLPLTCVFAFVACVIKHNHIHCHTFISHRWNRLMDYWLGFCTGQPTAAIIAVHNERHHAQSHSDQDCVRSTLV